MSIQRIESTTVHRLCSGQVIHDIVSCIKELVENAIDANATSIDIVLHRYGLDLIDVSDDGDGIRQSDYSEAVKKHSTSKIVNFSDIYSVQSLGFRGEALSSLCGLAKVSIKTRTQYDTIATRISYDANGNIISQEPTSRNIGTTVSIQEIFYNIPVRRQALQKNMKMEYTKVVALLSTYFLSYPQIKFTLINVMKSREVGLTTIPLPRTLYPQLVSPSASPLSKSALIQPPSSTAKAFLQRALLSIRATHAIRSLYGPKELDKLEFISLLFDISNIHHVILRDQIATSIQSIDTHYIQRFSTYQQYDFTKTVLLTAFISRIDDKCARSSHDRQFTFLNSRPVDMPTLTKGMTEIYRQYSNKGGVYNSQGSIPALFLYFSTLGDYDINLTPNKRTALLRGEKEIITLINQWLIDKYESRENVYTVNHINLPNDGKDMDITTFLVKSDHQHSAQNTTTDDHGGHHRESDALPRLPHLPTLPQEILPIAPNANALPLPLQHQPSLDGLTESDMVSLSASSSPPTATEEGRIKCQEEDDAQSLAHVLHFHHHSYPMKDDMQDIDEHRHHNSNDIGGLLQGNHSHSSHQSALAPSSVHCGQPTELTASNRHHTTTTTMEDTAHQQYEQESIQQQKQQQSHQPKEHEEEDHHADAAIPDGAQLLSSMMSSFKHTASTHRVENQFTESIVSMQAPDERNGLAIKPEHTIVKAEYMTVSGMDVSLKPTIDQQHQQSDEPAAELLPTTSTPLKGNRDATDQDASTSSKKSRYRQTPIDSDSFFSGFKLGQNISTLEQLGLPTHDINSMQFSQDEIQSSQAAAGEEQPLPVNSMQMVQESSQQQHDSTSDTLTAATVAHLHMHDTDGSQDNNRHDRRLYEVDTLDAINPTKDDDGHHTCQDYDQDDILAKRQRFNSDQGHVNSIRLHPSLIDGFAEPASISLHRISPGVNVKGDDQQPTSSPIPISASLQSCDVSGGRGDMAASSSTPSPASIDIPLSLISQLSQSQHLDDSQRDNITDMGDHNDDFTLFTSDVEYHEYDELISTALPQSQGLLSQLSQLHPVPPLRMRDHDDGDDEYVHPNRLNNINATVMDNAATPHPTHCDCSHQCSSLTTHTGEEYHEVHNGLQEAGDEIYDHHRTSMESGESRQMESSYDCNETALAVETQYEIEHDYLPKRFRPIQVDYSTQDVCAIWDQHCDLQSLTQLAHYDDSRQPDILPQKHHDQHERELDLHHQDPSQYERHDSHDHHHIQNNTPPIQPVSMQSSSSAVEGLSRIVQKGDFQQMTILGQFNYGFIIARLHNDIYVIDQHAADEKYNYERYRSSTKLKQQPLIVPLPLELSRVHEQVVYDHQDIFKQLGFHLEFHGFDETDDTSKDGEYVDTNDTHQHSPHPHAHDDDNDDGDDDSRHDISQYTITRSTRSGGRGPATAPLLHRISMRSQPSYRTLTLHQQDIAYICEQLLLTPSSFIQRPHIQRLDAAFASRACRTSVMIGMPLPRKKLISIVHNLEGLEHPWSCPHGRATMRHLLDLQQLNTFLQKQSIRYNSFEALIPATTTSESSDNSEHLARSALEELHTESIARHDMSFIDKINQFDMITTSVDMMSFQNSFLLSNIL